MDSRKRPRLSLNKTSPGNSLPRQNATITALFKRQSEQQMHSASAACDANAKFINKTCEADKVKSSKKITRLSLKRTFLDSAMAADSFENCSMQVDSSSKELNCESQKPLRDTDIYLHQTVCPQSEKNHLQVCDIDADSTDSSFFHVCSSPTAKDSVGSSAKSDADDNANDKSKKPFSVPYYLESFILVLNTVINDVFYSELFNDEDLFAVETFRKLSGLFRLGYFYFIFKVNL